MEPENKELKIGSILYYQGTTDIATVEIIHGKNHFDCRDEMGIFTPNCKYESAKLNTEWLIDFGFYKNGTTEHPNQLWRLDCEEGYFDLEQIGDSFFLEDNKCHGTLIEYVHRLQNIVFELMSGQELHYGLKNN